MARRDIPRANDHRYKERPLTRDEIDTGVSTLTQQIGAALRTRHIRMNDDDRVIFLGHLPGQLNRPALYPTCHHRWSNNRAVVTRLLQILQRQGYVARLIEPQYTDGGWTELSFVLELPEGVRIVMT